MIRFLLNENISPLTAEFIRNLGYDIKSVREIGLKGAPDKEIVDFAIRDNRIIITLDLDYGLIYYRASLIDFGIVILRLNSQWYENINFVIGKFLKTKKLEEPQSKNSLIILTETRFRMFKKID